MRWWQLILLKVYELRTRPSQILKNYDTENLSRHQINHIKFAQSNDLITLRFAKKLIARRNSCCFHLLQFKMNSKLFVLLLVLGTFAHVLAKRAKGGKGGIGGMGLGGPNMCESKHEFNKCKVSNFRCDYLTCLKINN